MPTPTLPDGFSDVLLGRLQRSLDDPRLRYLTPPTAIPGARFTPAWRFEIASRHHGSARSFVLRCPPSMAHARLEVALHATLNTSGASLIAPRVLIAETATSELGLPYFVMEHLEGTAVLPTVQPSRFALTLPKLLRQWPQRLAAIISQLGRINTRTVEEQLRAHKVPDDLAHPARHLKQVTLVLGGIGGLEPMLAWLHDNQPKPGRVVVSHGDLWPTNVFATSHDTTALIDWNRGGIADPALDVGFAAAGFALMPEPFPPPGPISTIAHGIGQLMARRISNHCDDLVGGHDRVRYYQVLRCLVEVADVLGAEPASEPGWSRAIPALLNHAQSITGVPAHLTPT